MFCPAMKGLSHVWISARSLLLWRQVISYSLLIYPPSSYLTLLLLPYLSLLLVLSLSLSFLIYLSFSFLIHPSFLFSTSPSPSPFSSIPLTLLLHSHPSLLLVLSLSLSFLIHPSFLFSHSPSPFSSIPPSWSLTFLCPPFSFTSFVLYSTFSHSKFILTNIIIITVQL